MKILRSNYLDIFPFPVCDVEIYNMYNYKFINKVSDLFPINTHINVVVKLEIIERGLNETNM